MAAIAKSGTPSLATALPSHNEQIPGLRAGEAIAAGDLCRIGTNGLVVRTVGANAIHGVATVQAANGEAVTLYRSVRLGYGSGMVPGIRVYLSGTVAGGLDDAATYTEGTATINAQRVGFTVDAQRIQLVGL